MTSGVSREGQEASVHLWELNQKCERRVDPRDIQTGTFDLKKKKKVFLICVQSAVVKLSILTTPI